MDRAIDSMDRYIEGVLDGSIVVGRHVRNAVNRHVKDLARQQTDGFQCRFDRSIADKAIAAFPAIFCHTVDRWAGQPYTLSPFQAFITGSIFGWKWENNKRRFRKAYLSMARKMGKSTFAAAITHLLAQFDGVEQAQVYLTATKIDQAKVVFDEATRMCHRSEVLSATTDPRVNRINIPASNSYIKPLGSDRPFSGLNPSALIIDELHEFKEQHRPFLETMVTGFGSRSQPLQLTITTAGSSKSTIWKEEEQYAKLVSDGSVSAEEYFVFVAAMDEGDDVFDEANWPKSMPNLGVSVEYDSIRPLAKEAASRVEKLNEFRRFYANIEVSSNEQAIDPKEWDECQVTELSDWDTADVVTGAIDAGGRNDLAAAVQIARFPDGFDQDGKQDWRYELRCRCYMDKDTRRDLTEQPWQSWVYHDKLTITSQVFTDMRDTLSADMQRCDGRQIGFDPWNTQQMAEELQSEGFECVRISQSRYTLHEPLTLLLELIRKRKIKHDGSQPIFRWALGNLVINSDANERWMPDRKHSSEKIDPVVAAIMALRLASLAPSRTRGSLFIS